MRAINFRIFSPNSNLVISHCERATVDQLSYINQSNLKYINRLFWLIANRMLINDVSLWMMKGKAEIALIIFWSWSWHREGEAVACEHRSYPSRSQIPLRRKARAINACFQEADNVPRSFHCFLISKNSRLLRFLSRTVAILDFAIWRNKLFPTTELHSNCFYKECNIFNCQNGKYDVINSAKKLWTMGYGEYGSNWDSLVRQTDLSSKKEEKVKRRKR